MRVGVSTGHHPRSQGAIFEGMSEYKIAFNLVADICVHLTLLGIKPVMVPNLPLKEKVYFINTNRIDLCLELHFNDFFDKSVEGCETLYCPNSEQGRYFALNVHNWYAVTMSNTDRGVKEGYYKMKGAVIDYFLRYTRCPAIIVEPEFIAHYKRLPDRRVAACRGIAKGVQQYLQTVKLYDL